MSVAVEVVPRQLFIGGEWRDASGGATLGVEDPSTGEVFAEVADATPADARRGARRRRRGAGRSGRSTRRASAARSCGARTS